MLLMTFEMENMHRQKDAKVNSDIYFLSKTHII